MNRRRALAIGAALLLFSTWPAAPFAQTAASRFWPPQPGSGPAAASAERPAGRAQAAETLPAPGVSGAPVHMQVRDLGSHYEVVVANPSPGPTQVRVALAGDTGLRPVPALPTEAVLRAGSERTVARLYRDDTRTVAGYGLDLVAVPGDPRARPLDFPYRLPFENARVRVDQAFGGSYSHADAANRHALDFALPEGTPVLAARDGVVMEILAGDPRSGTGIRLLHEDGSMAVYAHLQGGSIPVRIGEQVRQGQRIAYSGNSGFSTAPHLHFAVQTNAGMQLRSIPFRMFADAGELKFPRGGVAATTEIASP